MLRGSQTVLGDAADDSQLFATEEFETVDLSAIKAKVEASALVREWDIERRVAHSRADEERRVKCVVAVSLVTFVIVLLCMSFRASVIPCTAGRMKERHVKCIKLTSLPLSLLLYFHYNTLDTS